MVQGECADEPLQRRVLTLKRAQLFGIGAVHTPTLSPPPIQRLLGNILVATDVADVSQSLGFWQHSDNLLGRKSVAFPQTSSRYVLKTYP
jgi:hypothetical protein